MQFYKVGDLVYGCESGGNRSGFFHRVQIMNKWGDVITDKRVQYYNRTWESYTFQSAMRQAQEKLQKTIEKCKKGKDWINYVWENWQPYDFTTCPPAAAWAD